MESVVLVSPDETLATNALFKNGKAFAAHGLDIDIVITGPGEPVVRAMLEGRGGYTHVCGSPIPAAVAGRGLKVLAAFQTSSFGLYAHPSIESLADLRGKRVVLAGSILRPAMETALRRHGLSMDSVKVTTPQSVGGAAGRPDTYMGLHLKVLDGTFDAVALNPPRSQAAMAAGLRCLLRFGDVQPIPTFALLTTDTLLRQQRDQVVRFVRGTLRSIGDFIHDRDLGMRLLRETGVPEGLLEGTYGEVRGYLRPEGTLPEEVQRLWIDWSRESLGLAEEVPLERVYDFSVLEEARRGG